MSSKLTEQELIIRSLNNLLLEQRDHINSLSTTIRRYELLIELIKSQCSENDVPALKALG